MTGFFKKGDGLESKLRAARSQPSDELVSRIEARISETSPRYRRRSFRYAVPAALTIAMISALAAVGGVSYAASSVVSAVDSVAKIFAPAKVHGTLTVAGKTSGGDQYEDGFQWGDKDHNHDGKPGMHKGGKDEGGNKGGKKGKFAPPLTAQVLGNTATVSTNFTIDEQAHLFISVIDKKTGKQILINQSKSKVGEGVKGKPAKNIDYQVLVPRTIPLKLALPKNLLLSGHTYAIQVIAKDPQGNKSKLLIPFTG